MISIKAAFQQICENLSPLYGEGEGRSIARIIFEDQFHLYDFSSEELLQEGWQLELQAIEKRLLKHEPLQYILCQADFYGLKFKVDQNVLIPRQETEELVYWVLQTLKTQPFAHPIRLIDIGTGSGCIPIVLKKEYPELEVFAIDVSQGALQIAKENARKNQTSINFFQFDILKQKNWSSLSSYNIIVSNPPYILPKEASLMPKNVTEFEPRLALFVPENDPLLFYRTIALFAQKHLTPTGLLFFEVNEFQAKQVELLLIDFGYQEVEIRSDINGKERMVKGKL